MEITLCRSKPSESSSPLLKHYRFSYTRSDSRLLFALDVDTRIVILTSVGMFGNIASDTIRWTVIFEKVQVTRLHAAFPSISRLRPAAQQRLLESLGRIVDGAFGGRVELHIVTPLHTAQCQ
jgi:hypothetical protein